MVSVFLLTNFFIAGQSQDPQQKLGTHGFTSVRPHLNLVLLAPSFSWTIEKCNNKKFAKLRKEEESSEHKFKSTKRKNNLITSYWASAYTWLETEKKAKQRKG